MKELMMTIGYDFKDEDFLKTALTHSSFANESRGKKDIDYNERLEFLGDSVLSLVISRFIYLNYKNFPEGELTKIRSLTVCEKSIYEAAKKIGLGKYLFLGKGEESSGARERMSILADAFEALIAAIYLDGGYDEAERVVLQYLSKTVKRAVSGGIFNDYKTALQEIVQKSRETLRYELVSESGPDHQKVFEVALYLNSNNLTTGSGKSKKEAEQMAAQKALELMGEL